MSFSVIQAINNLSALFGGLTTGQNKIESIDNLQAALVNYAPTGGIQASFYTPVSTNLVNISATVFALAMFTRIGLLVTVYGHMTVTNIAGSTPSTFEVSLPIASNIGAIHEVSGVMNMNIGTGIPTTIDGSVANNTAVIAYDSVNALATGNLDYTFRYVINP